ncbi:MAG TPA: polyphenol oxidase family protein [Thermoanaerobaculia bacterium]|nr:polyphenol oxidase family protein [Thermoanaerobaculia bacterium]
MLVEQSTLGRIVVPEVLPGGRALFYTTLDFRGRVDAPVARQIADVIRDRFGVEATLATCTQVHGVTVQRASPSPDWQECDSCDALWTAEARVALGIKVADCLPVTLIEGDVIANIHSGWRGTVRGVTAATLDAAPIDPAKAFAYLGPSIRVCCFEVGEEVAAQFDEQFVDRSYAKPHVDIPAFTVHILRTRRFAAERIFDSGLCTRCEGSIFHSFRRDGKGGSNLTVVAQ